MLLKYLKKKLASIDPLFKFWHFYITKRLRKEPTELIRRTLKKNKKTFCIQIGSNDGLIGDPLFSLISQNPKWTGLFVEPLPHLFDRLKDNYSFRKDLLFEKSAINDGSNQVFYWTDPAAKEAYPDLPQWFDQVGSFKEDHIYGVPQVSDILLEYRRTTNIQGITFQNLLNKYEILSFDLLHIDTEGYDWYVLAQVDLAKYKPKVILYEHKCLTEEHKALAVKHVSLYYNISDLGDDMFCVRK